MQFDSVEEFGRQLKLPGDPAAPARVAQRSLPCNLTHCICGGRGDGKCLPPPVAKACEEPESSDLLAFQLPPLPLTLHQERQCRTDGRPEDLDLGLLPPPSWAKPDALVEERTYVCEPKALRGQGEFRPESEARDALKSASSMFDGSDSSASFGPGAASPPRPTTDSYTRHGRRSLDSGASV